MSAAKSLQRATATTDPAIIRRALEDRLLQIVREHTLTVGLQKYGAWVRQAPDDQADQAVRALEAVPRMDAETRKQLGRVLDRVK